MISLICNGYLWIWRQNFSHKTLRLIFVPFITQSLGSWIFEEIPKECEAILKLNFDLSRETVTKVHIFPKQNRSDSLVDTWSSLQSTILYYTNEHMLLNVFANNLLSCFMSLKLLIAHCRNLNVKALPVELLTLYSSKYVLNLGRTY